MIKWINNLLIAAAITISRYMPQGQVLETPLEQGEIEPQKEMDEWEMWLHHDDVTQEEIAMLNSDDPDQIIRAQQAIFQRQQEVMEIFNDKPLFREMFQEAYLKNADLHREQTPMSERPGWGDDDDMPETFIGVNQETGDLEEIRYDDLPEWRVGG